MTAAVTLQCTVHICFVYTVLHVLRFERIERPILYFFLNNSSTVIRASNKTMSSDENEQNEIDCIDGDTCTEAELNQLFGESLRISSEEAISLQKDYILYLDNSR